MLGARVVDPLMHFCFLKMIPRPGHVPGHFLFWVSLFFLQGAVIHPPASRVDTHRHKSIFYVEKMVKKREKYFQSEIKVRYFMFGLRRLLMRTAQIDPNAVVDMDTQIGEFVVIEADARIAAGCKIGHHVIIHRGTVLGAGTVVGDHAVLGKLPQLAKTSTTEQRILEPLQIGINCQIGTGAILYAGTTVDNDTTIADLASVRENCRIGKTVLIGRGVAVENNTSIGDFTKIQT